jgi:hypothetical protein
MQQGNQVLARALGAGGSVPRQGVRQRLAALKSELKSQLKFQLKLKLQLKCAQTFEKVEKGSAPNRAPLIALAMTRPCRYLSRPCYTPCAAGFKAHEQTRRMSQ